MLSMHRLGGSGGRLQPIHTPTHGSNGLEPARAFLATANAGSLSAAGRQLGLTQPTLSRQVAAIDQPLGVTLFERVGKGLQLTTSAHELLAHARALGAAADALRLAASGRTQALGGVVSASASDAVAAWLPPLVLRLREQEPSIAIEVISSNALIDLRTTACACAAARTTPHLGRSQNQACPCACRQLAVMRPTPLPTARVGSALIHEPRKSFRTWPGSPPRATRTALRQPGNPAPRASWETSTRWLPSLLPKHLDARVRAKGTATLNSRVQRTPGHRPLVCTPVNARALPLNA